MSTLYRPQKRKYVHNDPFFEEGDIALRAHLLQKTAHSQSEMDIITEQANDLSSQYTVEIYCDECQVELASVSAFELHYDAVHCNVCSLCNKIFPGSNWLQLHLDEYHNVLLKMSQEKGQATYRCFVITCSQVFQTPMERQLHLIDNHQYPAYFPFDLVETGTLSFEERKRREERMDTDMEDITANVSKLKIPNSISFGFN